MPTLYQPQAIEQAIQAAGVNADYINSLLAESGYTHLRNETLQSLLQKNWSSDRRNGPVLNGYQGRHRTIGNAFDDVQQVLGGKPRAFYTAD